MLLCYPAVQMLTLVSCRKDPAEAVAEFSFRLQELFQKRQIRDPNGLAEMDRLLRDQFVDGSVDRNLTRALKALIRSTQTMTSVVLC